MDFTLQAIQEAQAKYTGSDFPKLIREFKRIGVVKNIYDLSNGTIVYEDKDGITIELHVDDIRNDVTIQCERELALKALKRNQVGESTFMDFCTEMAHFGVYKWISNLDDMTCSYYDLNDKVIIVEDIPSI